MPNQFPALAVRNLDIDLGGRPVLRDVNVSINSGELVGLVGPNGAGKTTLLRAILGLTSIRNGSVSIDGKIGRQAAHLRGYVPQRHEFAWDYPVTVQDVVATGLTGQLGIWGRMTTKLWRQVFTALEHVDMSDLRGRPLGELSGGQRQRVLIARALVTDPSLLLLDEPFTGLDQPTIDMLAELFKALARKGKALLMSTHDIPGAIVTCDRLVLLNRSVVADGPARSLTDEDTWMRTYQIGSESPLLATIKAVQ